MKIALALLTLLLSLSQSLRAEQVIETEICIYGGTPAGVMAAVAAARHGHTVALVDVNNHVGGVVSGGLVASDMGDRKTVGGLAAEFFDRIVTHYRGKYGEDSANFKARRNGATFEPHVAELVFEQMIQEQPSITVWKNHRYRSLAIDCDRHTPGNRVLSLVVDDLGNQTTRTFTAELFIDASYQPQVRLFWTPTHPLPGEKVIFKAIAGELQSPLEDIVWDFVGHGQDSAEGERVVHTFALDKVFIVSLLVTDAAGRRRLLTAEVPVGTAAVGDVTMDDFEADLCGRWNGTFPDYTVTSLLRYSDIFSGLGIHRDVVVRGGNVAPARARFQPTLLRAGRYQVPDTKEQM